MNEDPIAGVLLIDKPLYHTSMNVCARVRGKLRAGGAPKRIKVGHGGTLDPLATGLLVVMVGRATRLCQSVMDGTKTYHTSIDLSVSSPTQDLESEPFVVAVGEPPTLERVRIALTEWVGTVAQLPPEHSAMRVGGRRAYELAREGKPVPVEPRPVRIDAIDILGYEWPMLDLSITCGKGTYIRSLARDIGVSLQTGGMLRALRRVRSGPYDVGQAIALGELPDPLERETFEAISIAF